MAWIKIIAEDEADGLLAKIYRAAIARAGKVFNILKVQSNNPAALQSSLQLYLSVLHGESALSRVQREMLAVVVSKTNGCHY